MSSPFRSDLELNLETLLERSALGRKEAALALLALALAAGAPSLIERAREELRRLEVPGDQISDAEGVATLMSVLNVYFHFRTVIQKEEYFGSTGFHVKALPGSRLGRKLHEMLAFAVSVLNGCESCIIGHETELRNLGVGVEAIHDLVRLASLARGYRVMDIAWLPGWRNQEDSS